MALRIWRLVTASFVSVVPAHTTAQRLSQNFRSLDANCRFEPFQFPQVRQIIDEIHHLRDKGYLVYDSDEYLCLFPSLLPVGDVAGVSPLAPGLTPRQALDPLAGIPRLDVELPTSDGRRLTLSRYTQPDPPTELLLQRLGKCLL